MDIKFLQVKKAEMESEIHAAVAAAITKFREVTGYSPGYIDIDLLDVTPMGEGQPQYMVDHITTNIDINGVSIK